MTPELKARIEQAIRELDVLGYEKQEVIDFVASEEKVEPAVVEAAYNNIFHSPVEQTGDEEDSAPEIVQPAPEAIRFINKHFEPSDVICVVLIDPKTGYTKNLFTKPSHIDNEFIESLHKANQTQNIYLGMNAYNPSLLGEQKIAEVNKHGRTEDNVVAVRNLYADADHDGAAVLEKIKANTIVPTNISTVLESSPGKFNIIWRVGDVAKDEAKPILKAVAQTFNTDPSVAELARILRIPGFANVKYDSRPIVKIATESDGKYSRSDFKLAQIAPAGEPDTPAPGGEQQSDAPPCIRAIPSWLKSGDFDSLLAALPTVYQGLNNNNPEGIAGRDVFVYKVCCKLQGMGWTDSDIYEAAARVASEKTSPVFLEHRARAKSALSKPKGPGPVPYGGKTAEERQQEYAQQANAAANASNEVAQVNWRSQFRTIGEMQQGEPKMIIEGVLQEEGICGIGALPGSGKTLVALGFAKAICLGEPLFDIPEYFVKKPRNVIYLIPESSDRPFRMRCESFRLPNDERFMTRTISMGVPLKLQDPALIQAVRELHPVIILDTMRRFTYTTDENAAAQNKMFFDHALNLRAEGALSVMVNHHATKASGKEEMTLENMFAGTGDIGAMFDEAYGIRADRHLYQRGAGPLQIEIVNLKDREMHGGLTRLRLAASYKKPGKIFPVSYINEMGNFHVMTSAQEIGQTEDMLVSLVSDNPDLSRAELSEQTRLGKERITRLLGNKGWHSVQGGKSGHSPWHRDNGQPCPYAKPKRGGINLDGKAA